MSKVVIRLAGILLFFFFFYPWDEILLRGSLFMLSCSELGSEVMQVKCFLFSV